MGAAEQKVEPLTIYDGSLNGTPGMWSLPVVLNYGYFDTGLTTQNQSVSIRNTEADPYYSLWRTLAISIYIPEIKPYSTLYITYQNVNSFNNERYFGVILDSYYSLSTSLGGFDRKVGMTPNGTSLRTISLDISGLQGKKKIPSFNYFDTSSASSYCGFDIYKIWLEP